MIWNECPFKNDSVTTISGHFFANHMFIFHKTEVQTVILRGWTDLNLDWFKSYGFRCILRLGASSANSQKVATDKWSFYNHMWSFFANYMFIFHKNEIQAVILRCLMSLNHFLVWKLWHKRHKNKIWHLLHFCGFCHNFYTN